MMGRMGREWAIGTSCRITVCSPSSPSPPCLQKSDPSSRQLIQSVAIIGAKAAQVVPHVHFHIIPRVGDVPEVKARSWTVFGKGQREELGEEEAGVLVGRMRRALGREVEREGVEGGRLLLGGEGSGDGDGDGGGGSARGKGGGWKL